MLAEMMDEFTDVRIRRISEDSYTVKLVDSGDLKNDLGQMSSTQLDAYLHVRPLFDSDNAIRKVSSLSIGGEVTLKFRHILG